MFLALNSKGRYQSLGNEKQSCCRVFPSATKREFGHFHVVSCNDGKEMYKKRVIHVQNCCFANQTYCFFAVLVAVASSFLKLLTGKISFSQWCSRPRLRIWRSLTVQQRKLKKRVVLGQLSGHKTKRGELMKTQSYSESCNLRSQEWKASILNVLTVKQPC